MTMVVLLLLPCSPGPFFTSAVQRIQGGLPVLTAVLVAAAIRTAKPGG